MMEYSFDESDASALPVITFRKCMPRRHIIFDPSYEQLRRQQQLRDEEKKQKQRASSNESGRKRRRQRASSDDDEVPLFDDDDSDDDDDDDDDSVDSIVVQELELDQQQQQQQQQLSQSAAKKKSVQFKASLLSSGDGGGAHTNDFLQQGSASDLDTPFISKTSLVSTQLVPQSGDDENGHVEFAHRTQQQQEIYFAGGHQQEQLSISQFQTQLSQQHQQQQLGIVLAAGIKQRHVSVVRVLYIDFDTCMMRRAFIIHRWDEPTVMSSSSSSSDDDDDDTVVDFERAASTKTMRIKAKSKLNPFRNIADLADAVKSRWRTPDLVAAAIDTRQASVLTGEALTGAELLSPRFVSIPGRTRYDQQQAASASVYFHNALPSTPESAMRAMMNLVAANNNNNNNHNTSTSVAPVWSPSHSDAAKEIRAQVFHFIVPVAATSVASGETVGNNIDDDDDGDDDTDDDEEMDSDDDDDDSEDETDLGPSSSGAALPSSSSSSSSSPTAFLLLGSPPIIAPSVQLACALVSSQGRITLPQLEGKVAQQRQQMQMMRHQSLSASASATTMMTTPSANLYVANTAFSSSMKSSDTSNYHNKMGGGSSTSSAGRNHFHNHFDNNSSDAATGASLTHAGRLEARVVQCWLTPHHHSDSGTEEQDEKQGNSSSAKPKPKKSSNPSSSSSAKMMIVTKPLQKFILTDVPPPVAKSAASSTMMKEVTGTGAGISLSQMKKVKKKKQNPGGNADDDNVDDGFASPDPPPNASSSSSPHHCLPALVLPSLAPGILVRYWIRRNVKAFPRTFNDTLICRILAIHVYTTPGSVGAGNNRSSSLRHAGGGGRTNFDGLCDASVPSGFVCPKFTLQEVVSGRVWKAKIWPVDLERIE